MFLSIAVSVLHHLKHLVRTSQIERIKIDHYHRSTYINQKTIINKLTIKINSGALFHKTWLYFELLLTNIGERKTIKRECRDIYYLKPEYDKGKKTQHIQIQKSLYSLCA